MSDPELDADEEVFDLVPAKALRLTFPAVSFNDREYTDLRLTEPTVQQLLDASKVDGAIAQTLALIKLNSGVPLQVLHQLPQRALTRCGDYFAAFSPPSPAPTKDSGETGEG
ncbi:phage tail assembly protein [Roseomonas sp. USHLN139]|uniref:phage tail assembly protein n=1 Tax=Roseomonas sp. USHLN139 TaxID=3081298 RepID=UPI003B015EFA